MINKIKIAEGFVKPIEQQVIKASTYIEEKVAPKVSIESIYSSPFALIKASTPAVEHVLPAGVAENLHFFG